MIASKTIGTGYNQLGLTINSAAKSGNNAFIISFNYSYWYGTSTSYYDEYSVACKYNGTTIVHGNLFQFPNYGITRYTITLSDGRCMYRRDSYSNTGTAPLPNLGIYKVDANNNITINQIPITVGVNLGYFVFTETNPGTIMLFSMDNSRNKYSVDSSGSITLVTKYSSVLPVNTTFYQTASSSTRFILCFGSFIRIYDKNNSGYVVHPEQLIGLLVTGGSNGQNLPVYLNNNVAKGLSDL